MEQINTYPIRTLIVLAFGVIAISVALVLLLLISGGNLGQAEQAATIVTSTIASASAIAGAVVAISLATLANQQVITERRRDEYAVVHKIFETMLGRSASILFSMQQMFAAYIRVESSVTDALNNSTVVNTGDIPAYITNLKQTVGQNRQNIERDIDSLCQGLNKLSDAYQQLSSDVYSDIVWRRFVGRRIENRLLPSFAAPLGDEQRRLHLEALRSPGEMSAVLQQISSRIAGQNADRSDGIIGALLDARLAANLGRAEGNNAFDHAAVRSFFSLGFFMMKYENGSKWIPYGSLLIEDTISIFGSPEEYVSALSDLTSGVAEAEVVLKPIRKIVSEASLENFVGPTLNTIVSAMRDLHIQRFIDVNPHAANKTP